MKKDIQFRCFLFLVTISVGFAQNSNNYKSKLDKLSFDSQEANRDSLVLWQERAVLHIANKQVSPNNPLFFKGYLLTGIQQNRNSFSGVLNVELLDGNGTVVKKQFHEVVDGMVEGHMKLPKNIVPGKYFFKAYTRWMQNYGEDVYAVEDISVGGALREKNEVAKTSDILITPEGGTLLSDQENRLVIKIPYAQSTKVGRVLDEKRQEVATVSYYSTGLGSAIFKPEDGKLYQLELENGEMYPIPKAETQGYLLHVSNLNENNVKIRVTASSEVLGTKVKLVGTSGGISYFEKELEFKNDKSLDINLSKRGFPKGIFTLRLVDVAGTELARRPFWIDGERLYIDIKLISSDSDEKAFKIKVTDKKNSPVKTQLALSVNRHDVEAMGEYSNIRPNFLTYTNNSETDKISLDRKNRFLQDLNILVSDVDNISTDEDGIENNPKFSIQKGLEFKGHAYNLDNKLLENTTIQIMAQTEDGVWLKETETDSNGLLRLEEIQITGSSELIFRTKGVNTKSRLVKVVPFKEWEQEERVLYTNSSKEQGQPNNKKTTSSESNSPRPNEPLDTTGLIELEEVEISKKLDKKQKDSPSVYGIDVPQKRIKYQDPKKTRSIGKMLSEIPGVIVSGDFNVSPSVTIPRASGPVLYVLDGFPLAQGNQGPSLGGPVKTPLSDIMNMVSAADIERIELLIGPDAAIYGARGSGGVISMYTRSGKGQKFIQRKEGQLVFEGYEPVMEFNAYIKKLSKRIKDRASLLYWYPKLETDENGEAIIRLPVLESNSVIKIEASTITLDGMVGWLSTKF